MTSASRSKGEDVATLSEEMARRECEAVWRCAVGDFTGALDVLKNQWLGSRRKADRAAGEKLGKVLDLVWAARSPAPGSYSNAAKQGLVLIGRIKTHLTDQEGQNP